MEITPAIRPDDKNIYLSYYLLDKAIQYFNQNISLKNWHHQITEKERYYAIIIPFEFYPIMDQIIDIFRDSDWCCFWDDAYDTRGPHRCFYISKDHFKQD